MKFRQTCYTEQGSEARKVDFLYESVATLERVRQHLLTEVDNVSAQRQQIRQVFVFGCTLA